MTEQEIELMKKQIEIQLKEYADEINRAVSWWQRWKLRQPKGFRSVRNQESA